VGAAHTCVEWQWQWVWWQWVWWRVANAEERAKPGSSPEARTTQCSLNPTTLDMGREHSP